MKRLVGYDSESQEHNPETLRHYLYGGHVADYMRHLMEEDEEKYKTHFARFIKEGVTADGVSVVLGNRSSNSGVWFFLSWNKCTRMHMQRSGRTPRSPRSNLAKTSRGRG